MRSEKWEAAGLPARQGSWIGLVILVDQISKFLVAKFFPEIIIKNPGLPFGIGFSAAPMGGQGFFNLFIVSAALVIFVWAAQRFFSKNRAATALIIGAALGNLADRMSLGYVRDFIDIGIGTMNLADIAVWLGIVVLLWDKVKLKNQN